MMRQYSSIDRLISCIDKMIHPFKTEEAYVASLMRVNHSGEICAQALYRGQAWVARDQALKEQLHQAASDEEAHLDWCSHRLDELNGRPSLLAPVWAGGSFVIGALAGLAGDKVSLGFLAETEYQVTRHLDLHLKKLPEQDIRSREILLKMREEELQHAKTATEAGGVRPSPFIRGLMAVTASIMTFTARFI